MDYRIQALNEIDKIVELVTKADKWEILANQLSNLLLEKVTGEETEAINDAIRFIAAGKGSLTEQEIGDTLDLLESRLGEPLSAKLKEDVAKYQLKTYKKAQTELGIKFEFNQTDYKALRWLEKDQMYWIGSHYSRTVRERILKAGQELMKDSYKREELSSLYRKTLKDQFNRSSYYWEGLANHIITRAREFGATEGYVKAGITSIKLVNERPVSEICKVMAGRIIKVSDAVIQRDKMMKAKNPEAVKKIAPWFSDKLAKKLAAMTTHKIVSKYNAILPPYHFHCKTRSVMAYDNEVEEL